MRNIKSDFKFLENNIYLDSGAGALKPKQVIDKVVEFYNTIPLNSHSTESELGVELMRQLHEVRTQIGELFDGTAEDVVFTSGATDSMNRIAMLFGQTLKEGDEIMLSEYNHSSNMVPWIQVAKRYGAKVVFAKDDNFIESITDKTKIISYASINNTVYMEHDEAKIYEIANSKGILLLMMLLKPLCIKKYHLIISMLLHSHQTNYMVQRVVVQWS